MSGYTTMWQDQASGISLSVGQLLTYLFYVLYWKAIQMQFKRVRISQGRYLTQFVVYSFWLSEIIATTCWLYLWIIFVSRQASFENEAVATAFFISTGFVSVGNILWPVSLALNADQGSFFAEFLTICWYTAGAWGMAISAFLDGQIVLHSVLTPLAALYMAIHFTSFDAIGWAYLSYRTKKDSFYKTLGTTDWTELKSTLQVC